MAKKHFEISGKKVIAEVEKLTEKELNAVKNFLALGYELIEKPKEEKSREVKNTKLTFEEVKKYVEENGTEEQKKAYWEKFNTQSKNKNGELLFYENDVFEVEEYFTTEENGKTKRHTKVVRDSNGEKIIIHRKGEKRINGHIGTLRWFSETFPEYYNSITKKIKY